MNIERTGVYVAPSFLLLLNHVHLHRSSGGGVVQGNCSLWPDLKAEVFVCLIHFSISHPTKKNKL